MVKASELKSLEIDELKEKADNLKKELMQYRFQMKMGKLEKGSKLSQVKKDIARVLTVMTEKKKGEAKA